jgi:uncharacterized protein
MTPAAHVAVGAVRIYQWTVRPVIGANCRFFPSCSDYAVDAFRAHGAFRGGGLAAWRILRCNPWHEGGYDPVPACDCPAPPPTSRPSPPPLSWPGLARPSPSAKGGRVKPGHEGTQGGQDDCRAGA